MQRSTQQSEALANPLPNQKGKDEKWRVFGLILGKQLKPLSN